MTQAFKQGFLTKLAQAQEPKTKVASKIEAFKLEVMDKVAQQAWARPSTRSLADMAGAESVSDIGLYRPHTPAPKPITTPMPLKPEAAKEPSMTDQAGELFDKAKGTATDLYGKAKGWVMDPANKEKMMYGGAGIGAGLGLYGLYNLLNRPAPRRRPRPGDEYED